MKLREVILKNFRGYYDETRISINDLTALIGKNDVENQLYLKHSRFSSIKQKSSLVIKMCSTRQKTQ